AEYRGADRSCHRLRHDVGRIGEAVEEIAALEVRPERLDSFPIRGDVGFGGRFERASARLVVQAYHRATRQIRASSLNLIPGNGGGRLQMQNRDAIDDREDAALAAEDAVRNLVAAAAMTQRC